jgi:NADPH:quinone reductase-like Zn-dependent oxidoreductase
MAGVVEAIGTRVTRFAPGDRVFGTGRGSFAELACAAEAKLAALPADVTFEQGAALPVAALTALQGLRDAGRLRPGQRVLVHGAGGGVGTFAVQVARLLGAEVTAVTRTETLETVRALGAGRVLDHRREDFLAGGERYDLIFDCFENRPLSALGRALEPEGRHVAAGGPVPSITAVLVGALGRALRSRLGRRKFVSLLARVNAADLALVGGWVAQGRLVPVLDRRAGLSEVPGAFRDLAEGRACGKLVIAL